MFAIGKLFLCMKAIVYNSLSYNISLVFFKFFLLPTHRSVNYIDATKILLNRISKTTYTCTKLQTWWQKNVSDFFILGITLQTNWVSTLYLAYKSLYIFKANFFSLEIFIINQECFFNLLFHWKDKKECFWFIHAVFCSVMLTYS